MGTARLAWLFILPLAGGCNAFEQERLGHAPDPSGGTQRDGGVIGTAGGGGPIDAGGDAAIGAAGSDSPGGGGSSGGGRGGSSGGGDSGGSASQDCMPNPDPVDDVCTEVCTEVCNDADDDCDGEVDEGEASDSCELANASSFCQSGECLIVDCESGYRDCDGDPETGCEVAEDDVDHCGSCGRACNYVHGVAACVDGECERESCEQGWDDCDDNPDDCETATISNDNCGACGSICSDVPNATASCAEGVCGPGECIGAHGDCNELPADGCEIELASLTHCGGCNQACDFVGSADECIDGTCFAQVGGCEAGFGDCDGDRENGCESLRTDENCGACGDACNTTLPNSVAGTRCMAGTCELECAAGYGDCDGDAQTGCETSLDSLTHCGGCNMACARDNAVATCATGSCRIEMCASSAYGDCNDEDSDGCETDLGQDSTCGGCDSDCADVAGRPFCSGGQCTSISCTAPQADCDGDGASCEVNLDTSSSNCGACGNACAFTNGVTPHATLAGCVSRSCEITCEAGWGDCNGSYEDGCEVHLNSLTHCDTCNQACAIPNASARCTTWTAGHFVCEVATCSADYGDCDGDGMSCESPLDTPAHCNSCTTECDLFHAVEACTGASGSRSCTIAACAQSYYKDCNTQAADGCEIDVRSTVAHCGACSNDCRTHANVSSATCGSSVCSYTCAAGFMDCDATPGCETDIRTLSDCGGCDVACARTNATATCATGSCAIASCNMGFDNCDGSSGNGCEPLNTLTDCGSCTAPVCSTPNATPTCTTGTCQVGSCSANFENCDGSAANGCERDTRSLAMGGFGPCLPDAGCVKQTLGGHEYFFCPTLRSWADARARCQLQLAGDLVHIDDAAENTFVKNNAGGDAWIGATDAATEGNWRWIDGDVQFWMGAQTGVAVGGLYHNWEPGTEPNNSGGNQDCGVIWKTGAGIGTWDDEICTATKRFVCEVADLCPSDPLKTRPLQCGCGTPDVHSDADGIADCAEACDLDPAKVAAGACGCGVADTNSDGDALPDCTDACDTDPNKVVAGQCGCNNPDVDSDSDGTMDCNDACPYDPAHTMVGTCAYAYTPSNFMAGQVSFSGALDVNVNCDVTLDSTGTAQVSVCGANITPVIVPQTGGPDLWILRMASLTVTSGFTLRIVGSRPAVLAVAGNATVNGTIDVSAVGGARGAGGNVSCAVGSGQGTDGVHDGDGNDGDGGGGGGGFGSVGFGGGSGDNGASGQAGGAAVGNSTLTPLRGGCRGGSGGTGGNVNGAGAGGGAVQLSAGGRLTVGGSAVIAAAGGGGQKGGASEESGGGGGSGGAILLEAYVLSIDANAWITANGGGGAGGNSTNTTSSAAGTDGLRTSTSRAPGGAGANGSDSKDSDGGGGGLGSALGGAATAGANATDRSCVLIFSCGDDGGGGGGGGGGVGRIRIHGIQAACSVPSVRVSPAASVACP
jgi:hypothetical protein